MRHLKSNKFKTKLININHETCFSLTFVIIISHTDVQHFLQAKPLILGIQLIPHLLPDDFPSTPRSPPQRQYRLYYSTGLNSCVISKMLSLGGSTASSLTSGFRKKPFPLALMARQEGLSNITFYALRWNLGLCNRSHSFGL